MLPAVRSLAARAASIARYLDLPSSLLCSADASIRWPGRHCLGREAVAPVVNDLKVLPCPHSSSEPARLQSPARGARVVLLSDYQLTVSL